MRAIELQALSEQLRSLPGLLSKRDIQEPAAVFEHHPFPELGEASRLGDDTALIRLSWVHCCWPAKACNRNL